MSRTRAYSLPFTPLMPLAGALWLALAAQPAGAGDQVPGGALLSQPTPGYVEEAMASDTDRIETADTGRTVSAHRSRQALSASGRTKILGLAPTTPDARRRADAFMETLAPPLRWRLSGGGGGTIGFALDF